MKAILTRLFAHEELSHDEAYGLMKHKANTTIHR